MNFMFILLQLIALKLDLCGFDSVRKFVKVNIRNEFNLN